MLLRVGLDFVLDFVLDLRDDRFGLHGLTGLSHNLKFHLILLYFFLLKC